MAVIGVDIDGIVANFVPAYANLTTEVSGIGFPRIDDPTWPTEWWWDLAAGVTKEQQRQVWAIIGASRDFWFNLHPYADAEEFLRSLYDMQTDHDIYFITDRKGKRVKAQTEDWLIEHGFESPTVIISGNKGAVCAALKITHYIDDKNENCADVLTQSPSTLCYMLARPYNSIAAVTVPGNITRVDSLKEFLDGIQN